MPLDPSIFMQGAQLNQRSNEVLLNNLSQGLEMGLKKKALENEQKKAGLDFEKLAGQAIYKAQMGQPLGPEDVAAIKTFDALQTSQNAINPATGDVYPKARNIFETLQGANATPYQPTWMPPDAVRTPGIVPDADAKRMQAMGQPPSLPNKGYMNDLGGDLMPPVGDNYNEVSGVTPNQRDQARGSSLPIPQNPKQALSNFEAQTDIAKTSEIDRNKILAQQEADQKKLNKDYLDTLPILRDMLKQNSQTIDAPYAGNAVVKMGTRVYDKATGSDVTGPMDLLQQNRLEIAAPLAKQLGVNPTDSDFKNTLNRIFDENASKESRNAQIQNIINKIERRQNLISRGFEQTGGKQTDDTQYQTTPSGIKYKVVQ